MAEPTAAEPCTRSRRRLAQTLRPLASRPYRLMWLGATTSSVGDAVVEIALVFAILHIGGTASDIGVIAAVQTVARVAFVLAGGVWADRLKRQYVMLAADAVRAAVQATLAILLLTGHARVWELGVGAALYGAATSFFGPASMALIPETVPTAELQQANSLLGLPQSFFGIGGPAAGGVLIAVFGTGWLFAVDAATFGVSLVCLALLRVPARPMPPPASFTADLAEGWHELVIRPWYLITLIAHACGNFTLPAFFVLGPVIAARSLGGASAWGFISAGWGVGAIAGGIVALRVRPRRPLVVATLLTTLIALPPLALAFAHSAALIAAALVVFAFEVVWSNNMFTSAIQALIPDQVRSRVDSYDMLISIVIMPVGYLLAGPLSSSAGFTATLVGAAVVGGVPAALTALVPGNRAVRRTPDGEIVGPGGEIVRPAGEIVRPAVADPAVADPADPAAAG